MGRLAGAARQPWPSGLEFRGDGASRAGKPHSARVDERADRAWSSV